MKLINFLGLYEENNMQMNFFLKDDEYGDIIDFNLNDKMEFVQIDMRCMKRLKDCYYDNSYDAIGEIEILKEEFAEQLLDCKICIKSINMVQ